MIQSHEAPQRALKRMLANGPITAMPKRPGDQELLAMLAAAHFDPGNTYTEPQVNEALEAWLETFTEPYGIDHVTMRRLLVDMRLLRRTTSGSHYEANPEMRSELEAIADLAPAEVLELVKRERERRKARHPS